MNKDDVLKSLEHTSERYIVVDTFNGESMNLAVFLEKPSERGWERAYVETLCNYMNLSGNAITKILTHLIRNKDGKNVVAKTNQMIATDVEVSITSVNKIMRRLIKEGFAVRLQVGGYFLTPHMIRYGSRTHGAILIRLWDEVNGGDND